MIPTRRPPAVSVCLPTFNRARHLGETIASVLGQTFTDLELVVCDDASADATGEVAAGFQDGRLRYHRNPANLGLAANWVKALGLARGELCALIGDDDRWEPGFLERAVAALAANPEADFAFADHWMIDDSGAVMVEASQLCTRHFGRDRLREGLHRPCDHLALASQAIPIAVTLMHRRTLEHLDARAGLVLDYHFFARLALAGSGAYYIPERLGAVRSHPGSVSMTRYARIWPDLRWACADLDRRAARGRARSLIRAKWADAIFWELVAIGIRERHWARLPSGLARALAEAPTPLRPALAGRLVTATASRAWRAARPGGTGLL